MKPDWIATQSGFFYGFTFQSDKMPKYLVSLVLLLGLGGCTKTPPGISYYVALNPLDCSNCLAVGPLLPKLAYFNAIHFVVPASTSPAFAAKVVQELVKMKVAPDHILRNDSLFEALAINERSSFVFKRGSVVLASGQLAAITAAGVQAALAPTDLRTEQRQLLPDSAVFSPATRLYCGTKNFWIFDPRFNQVREFSYAEQQLPRTISAAAWPLWRAHQAVYGDTASFAQVRHLLPVVRSIGKDKLELNSVQVIGDSLFANVVYREPLLEKDGADRSIGVHPRPLIVNIVGGQPVWWRSMVGVDSAGLSLGAYGEFARFPATHQWLLPYWATEAGQEATLPYLGWAAENKRQATRWLRAHPARLPAFFAQRHLQNNYTDYRLLYPLIVFRYANAIGNLRTASGSYAAVPGFSDADNDFKSLVTPTINFEILDAIQRDGMLTLLVRADKSLYAVVLQNGTELYMRVRIPISYNAAVKWAWRNDGALCGFDTENKTFLVYRNIAGS